MPKPKVDAAGGFPAIAYSFRKGRETGGTVRLIRRLASRNTCKTCAFGMGGQRGGMVNEAGHFPEVCKKSIQAVAGDLQPAIDASFFERHSIADLERFTPRELEQAGRLAFPVRVDDGDTHFRRVGWDEALDVTAEALRVAPRDATFFYASGRSSNEAAFLMQVLARAYGTRNVHNCSSYCHQASGVALGELVGSGTATVVLDDLDDASVAVVAGANPASNHPRLIVKLVELRERGGKVVIVNPVRELGLERFRIPSQPGSLLLGSDVSDLYLQPHIGSDVAVYKAALKALVGNGAVDRAYVEAHVDGWDAVERDAVETPWSELLGACGLSRSDVEAFAEILAGSSRGILSWAMGLTHHVNGVDNVRSLAHLALARGWVGRRGGGLMPIRGHSNVQGVGSVGFTPKLKRALARKMEEVYGLPVSGEAGLDTYASMRAAYEGRIRAAVMLGGNLYGSNPDSAWARDAMRRIGTTAYLTTKLNTGHVHGRGGTCVVLPVLARDEERQSTTQESMFNFVRLSDGGEEAPAGELRSEVEVVCALASRLLPDAPFPFDSMRDHRSIRRAIASVVPGWDRLSEIDDTKREFQVDGRTFHEPRFPTDDGRAKVRPVDLPDFEVAPDAFRLMTLRSEGQFNTVVYEDEDLYRGVDRRDVVMMNAEDGARLGVGEGDPVVVSTETGEMEVVTAWIDIPCGNVAMYFPEANVLVPRRIDARSGTPAFKSVVARIRPGASG